MLHCYTSHCGISGYLLLQKASIITVNGSTMESTCVQPSAAPCSNCLGLRLA